MTESHAPLIDRIPPAVRRGLARAAGGGLVLAVFGPVLGVGVLAGWAGTVVLARRWWHGIRLAGGLTVAAALAAIFAAPSAPLLIFAPAVALVLGLVDRYLTGPPAPASSAT